MSPIFPYRPARLNLRHLLVLAFLLPLFAGIHVGAYWLRFEGQLTSVESTQIWSTLGSIVFVKFLVFAWFGIYRGWGRYVTFHDLVVLGQATTVSSLLTVFADYFFFPDLSIPRSVFLMDWGATILVIGGMRSLLRFVEERVQNVFSGKKRQPVFIVGANDSGEALLRVLRRNFQEVYRVVGFITNSRAKVNEIIGGVPVIGQIEDTCQLAKKYGVSEVLMTAGEMPGQTVRQLVEDGRKHGVSVKVLPSYQQILDGRVGFRPREVSIEDLLRRDPVKLNLKELHRWIDGQVLLVTGSAGSIGSEICRQLVQFAPRKLVVVDQSETGQFFLERELRRLAPDTEIEVWIADVCDGLRMNQIFGSQKPDIVFHAAAYKHVPLMESNPGEGVKNIAMATRLLADLSHQHSVTSFVMISTDKAVNPTSVMGACKRVAELYVQALATKSDCRFVTVRFGNVLDSAGSVIPIFREQLERGGPITVTHPEMERFFMTIPEASQLVVQAGAMGRGGEIFVLDMGDPVKIVNLAEDMIRLSGLTAGEDIEIEFVGKRPGEKLFEELHVGGEEHLPTSHPKIMVASSDPTNILSIRSQLEHLSKRTNAPRSEIVAALCEIVPEFDRDVIPSSIRFRAAG